MTRKERFQGLGIAGPIAARLAMIPAAIRGPEILDAFETVLCDGVLASCLRSASLATPLRSLPRDLQEAGASKSWGDLATFSVITPYSVG